MASVASTTVCTKANSSSVRVDGATNRGAHARRSAWILPAPKDLRIILHLLIGIGGTNVAS